jgi:hypothetical protein
LARAEAAEHANSAAPIMGLALRELQGDRQTVGIDEGVDLGRYTNGLGR